MSPKNKPVALFLVLAALALFASSAVATVPTDTITSPYGITIFIQTDAPVGSTVSIPVVKNAGAESIHGFDFYFVYDTTALIFNGITPGELFDSPGAYEWEYFEYRHDTETIPAGQIKTIAVAETNDGDHHPLGYFVPDGTVLFTFEFTVVDDAALDCMWSPIRFYWSDCGDNAIAPDPEGLILAVSEHVYDWVGIYSDITDPTYGLPGLFGIPNSCISDPTIDRAIDFFNGGIEIHCTNPIDKTGDINCNEVYYEIADCVMFTLYFINGFTAFMDHIECSVAASDINQDGTYLGLEDLVYLLRIITGDAQPYPEIFEHDHVNITIVQDDDQGLVSLDYVDDLAAIHLIFNGEITPTLLFNEPGITMTYTSDSGYTRVLIYPGLNENNPSFIPGGTFLSYTGSALLTAVGAADYNDNVFLSAIENNGSGLTIPFGFDIGTMPDAVQGEMVSVAVTKTAGTEDMAGFDFLIGYDGAALSITDVVPGEIFDIPGDYEWEYFTYRTGPFDCEGDCPASLVRIVGLAETNDGSHHPLTTAIPNGTDLFTLDFMVTPDPTMEDLFVPVSFFWIDCGDNAIAHGPAGDSLALSYHVYDHNGVDIVDTLYGFPGYYGAPQSCFEGGPNFPTRFANYRSGGVDIKSLDEMRLIVAIDSTTAMLGETEIILEVRLRNPQDSVAGFSIQIQMDNPDLVEFGSSVPDTTAVDRTNSLISNWEFLNYRSVIGDHHDIFIVGLSNNMPPYTNAIPPQIDGVLLRLKMHAYDSVPDIVTDFTVRLIINENPQLTGFSTPLGEMIGIANQQYDPALVSFQDGFVTIQEYVYGDANGDATVNIADASYIINYIFFDGTVPDPLESADANGDGTTNIADASFIVDYIFYDGSAPIGP